MLQDKLRIHPSQLRRASFFHSLLANPFIANYSPLVAAKSVTRFDDLKSRRRTSAALQECRRFFSSGFYVMAAMCGECLRSPVSFLTGSSTRILPPPNLFDDRRGSSKKELHSENPIRICYH